MKEKPPIVMTTLGLAVLFGLIYNLRRQRASAREIREIRNIAAKNLTETQEIHRTLRRTRGTLNQLHKYVMPDVLPVPKGAKKAAS